MSLQRSTKSERIHNRMNKEDKVKYFEFLVNSYDKGTARIQGDHPDEVRVAIDSFFKAAKILVDHPEIEKIPTEYVNKLLESLAQHPQYHRLVVDLLKIINDGRKYDA